MSMYQNKATATEKASRIKVLLIDDEALFRKNVARLLEKRGFETRQAENGLAGLTALEKWAPAVVVLDVKMPGMDGLEVLPRIREQYPKIEVILLTGQASANDGVAGIKSGAFDYLYKPVEMDHLAGKIRQANEKIRLRAERLAEARFRAVVEQKMAAAERLAALGTLATGVAHEINNPLAVIKQSAALMRRVMPRLNQNGLPDWSKIEKSLANIEAGTERIRRITHQLLGYVGKNNAADAQVDMQALIEDVVSLVKGGVSAKNIAVTMNIGPGARTVRSEPYKLRQVVVNLMINALQASGAGDTIEISTALEEPEFVFSLADTGTGILPEHLGKIFDPFFTTKPPGEGTGLGLFITRSIVRALGGTVSAAGRPGGGSVFTVRLPLAAETDIAAAPDLVQAPFA